MSAALDPAAVLALRSARRVGSFFTVEFGAGGGGWQSLTGLATDPPALHQRIDVARRAIARGAACGPGDVPLRVTASIDLLGLTARIVSPALGACALAGVVPGLDAGHLWLRPGGAPVALTGATATTVTTVADAALALYGGVLEAVLGPLVTLYQGAFAVSARVLWGDVASALNGAAQVLRASGLEQRVPPDAVVSALLSLPLLAGTARTLAPNFRRNSCCLYYRIPGGALCGDCVLSHPSADRIASG